MIAVPQGCELFKCKPLMGAIKRSFHSFNIYKSSFIRIYIEHVIFLIGKIGILTENWVSLD